MKVTKPVTTGRRQFLRRLAAVAVATSFAGVGGCDKAEAEKRTIPPGRLPPQPNTKPK